MAERQKLVRYIVIKSKVIIKLIPFILLNIINKYNIFGMHISTVYDSAMLELINQNYDVAHSILADHLSMNISDLKALYLSFAIEQTRILDFESYLVEEKKFHTMADSIKEIFQKHIGNLKGKDSTLCLFYLANVYGGIAVMYAKTGNWFEGVKNAINSVSLLKVVKKKEPQFCAADLGIGIFNYYLSTSLKWFPFIDHKGIEDINSIKAALQSEFPYNYAAKNSLCWILIDRHEYDGADSIAQSVLDQFPDNTIFLRIKAFANLWSGVYDKALIAGRRLLELTEKRHPTNWSDLVASYTIIAQSYYGLGNERDAYTAAESIRSKTIPVEYLKIPHINKNIKIIENIYNKCIKEVKR